MYPLVLFIFGAAIGSFLNVVISRTNRGLSLVFPASHCPRCQTPLRWYDNIPLISYVVLRGQCRECRQSISWHYPTVELITAVLPVILYWRYGISLALMVFSIYSLFLVIIFFYDLFYSLILDRFSVPAFVVAVAGSLLLGLSITTIFWGVVVGAGFFWLQYVISKGKWIGGGDIRLGAVMGAMLGWQLLLVALFIAYLLGAAVGLVLIAMKKKELSSQLPFGTFLTAATFISFLFGAHILRWYLGLVIS